VKSENIKASIILATREDHETLEECMSSLISQDYEFKEFIVVIYEDDVLTRTIVKKYESFIDKLIVLKGEDAAKGAVFSRKVGIDNSKGDVIFLAEGDGLYPKNWVSKNLRIFETDPEVVGVRNRIKIWYEKGLISQCLNILGAILQDVHVFSRKAYEKIGGLDLNIKKGELVDLGKRLERCGKVVFTPRISWKHHRSDSFLQLFRKYVNESRGYFAFFRKYPMYILAQVLLITFLCYVVFLNRFFLPLLFVLFYSIFLLRASYKWYIILRETNRVKALLLSPFVYLSFNVIALYIGLLKSLPEILMSKLKNRRS